MNNEAFPLLDSREANFDYLEHARVRTYMLETGPGFSTPNPDSVFPPSMHLDRVYETLWRVRQDGQVKALAETFTERHPVLYTTSPAAQTDVWVSGMIDRNPWLDRLWLSSQVLCALESSSPGRRGPLAHLRIPGGKPGVAGCYFDGHAIGTGSFTEHRSAVEQIVSLHHKGTSGMEKRLWMWTESVGDGWAMAGAPVTVVFSEPLSETRFDRFITALLRKDGRYRLGGYAARRGPTKVHVTGVDYHMWQSFLLEATSNHLLMVLLRGMCGNTVHRVVANIQRSVDPRVEVWLGDEPYEQAVKAA